MLFRFLSYFKFLLKSTNEHGVHSPFVFNFVTKGLYSKRLKNIDLNRYHQLKGISKKKSKLLSKIIAYYEIEGIHFDTIDFEEKSNQKFTLHIFKNLNELSEFHFSKLNSKHIILVDGIYRNKQNYLNWQKVIKNKEATVTIDLFYFGLLFFRKEQAKEHFKIRA